MNEYEMPLAVVSHALSGACVASNNSEINRGGHAILNCRNFDLSKNALNYLGLGVEQVKHALHSSAAHWDWGARQQEGGEAFGQRLISLESAAQRGALK